MRFVEEQNKHYVLEDGVWHATELTNSPRQTILYRRHQDEITIDVADEVDLVIGQAIHLALANTKNVAGFQEERLVIEVKDGKVTLRSDYATEEYGLPTIIDYKTCKASSMFYGKDDWDLQLNIYRWGYYCSIGWMADRLKNQVIVKDWSRFKMMQSEDYPRVKTFMRTAPVQTIEDMQEWVEGRVSYFTEQEKLHDDDLAPCSADERWNKGDQWAVKKSAKHKTARGGGLYKTLSEAEARKTALPGSPVIEPRPGEDIRCLYFCKAAPFCNYWKANVSPTGEV